MELHKTISIAEAQKGSKTKVKGLKEVRANQTSGSAGYMSLPSFNFWLDVTLNIIPSVIFLVVANANEVL